MVANRENCFYLNETIRNTVKVLMLLSQTTFRPITAADVAGMTGLPEDFCEECLINLAFDEVIRETDQGFQALGVAVRKINRRGHKLLDQSFDDCGLPPPRVRLRSGEWAA
jgi:hypothetical protein